MEHAIIFAITLKPAVKAEQFEAYFKDSVAKAIEDSTRHEATTSSLYRSGTSPAEFIWITRFPTEEFDRVTRSAWPMVIRELIGPLKDLQRFAADLAIVSSSVLTSDALVAQWNEQFGRFSKISLEPAATS